MSSPTKPYLLRAMYEWCIDNGHTPYLACRITPQVRVPKHLMQQDEVVFNIGPVASPNLSIDNDWVFFSARFNGVSEDIWLPVGQVVGIFARETGEGMGFSAEVETGNEAAAITDSDNTQTDEKDGNPPPKRGLRLVK